jgi:hypothetical protein
MRTLVSPNRMSVALAVVAVLLTAGAGFCLFDTDGHDHDGVGLDLCTAILAVTIGGAFLVVLGVLGSATEPHRWAATPVPVAIPHPPPWR